MIRNFGRGGCLYRHRELGDSKWIAVSAHTIVIELPRAWKGLRGVIGLFGGGFSATHKRTFVVTRLTVGAPNDLQMERNLTGGLPVLYPGHLARLGPFRECSTPAHERKTKGVRRRRWECRIAKRTTGKMLGCKRRTHMQMQCT